MASHVPEGSNPTLTVDEVREEFKPFTAFDSVPVHYARQPRFAKNEQGTLCLFIPTGDEVDGKPVDLEYRITRDMWGSITADLGAGAAYFRRTPPELLLPQLNYWYGSEEADKDEVKVLVETVNDKTFAREIVRPGQTPVNAMDLLDVVHSEMSNGSPPVYSFVRQDGLKVVSFAARMPHSRHEIVSDIQEVGDVVDAGVLVMFSPIGAIAPSVQTYIERAWCTNGMTTTDQLDVWEGPGGEGSNDPMSWIPGALAEVKESFDAHYASIDEAARERVPEEHIETVVSDLFEYYALPQSFRAAVSRRLTNVNIHSMWDVMNAFTYAATHDTRLKDIRQQVRLMQTAGNIPVHSRRCESCQHLLRA